MRSLSPSPPAHRQALAQEPTALGPGHPARVRLGTPTQPSLLTRSPRAQSVLTRTSFLETPGTTQQSWAWQSLWVRPSFSLISLRLPHFTTSETSGTRCGATGCLPSEEDLPTTWPTARRRKSCLYKWSTPSTTLTMTWNHSGRMTSYDPPARPITRWRFAVPPTTSRWWLPTPSLWSPVLSPVCSLSMPSTPSPPLATTTPFRTPTPPPGYSRDWPTTPKDLEGPRCRTFTVLWSSLDSPKIAPTPPSSAVEANSSSWWSGGVSQTAQQRTISSGGILRSSRILQRRSATDSGLKPVPPDTCWQKGRVLFSSGCYSPVLLSSFPPLTLPFIFVFLVCCRHIRHFSTAASDPRVAFLFQPAIRSPHRCFASKY